MANSDNSSYILRYNKVSNAPEYLNGADFYQQVVPGLTGKQDALSHVLSSASAGGAATEELVVTGLLTTSTIYAVTQSVVGSNSLPMLAYTNDSAGHLKITWSADPGTGAKVVVVFIP